ncbi:MAG: PDZ domain-containing protein [Gemmataceae bacterium]
MAQREDLYALVSLMLGELNALHPHQRPASTPDEWTADLGRSSMAVSRPGLKVSEVLKHGPADKRGLNIKPGDIILSIDRVELNGKVNVSQLLNTRTSARACCSMILDPKDLEDELPRGSDRGEPRPHFAAISGGSRNAWRPSAASLGKLGHPHPERRPRRPRRRDAVSGSDDSRRVIIDVRAVQRRRLHARSGTELPERQGAHVLPSAGRRRGVGVAELRLQSGRSRWR